MTKGGRGLCTLFPSSVLYFGTDVDVLVTNTFPVRLVLGRVEVKVVVATVVGRGVVGIIEAGFFFGVGEDVAKLEVEKVVLVVTLPFVVFGLIVVDVLGTRWSTTPVTGPRTNFVSTLSTVPTPTTSGAFSHTSSTNKNTSQIKNCASKNWL